MCHIYNSAGNIDWFAQDDSNLRPDLLLKPVLRDEKTKGMKSFIFIVTMHISSVLRKWGV